MNKDRSKVVVVVGFGVMLVDVLRLSKQKFIHFQEFNNGKMVV